MIVTERVLALAQAGDQQAFSELTDPYRGELHVHCYRILGSVQDAEDMLQETLLSAWRGLARFQGRASVRSWLYRIATNRCLNALRDRDRQPKPVTAMSDLPEPTRWTEPIWLQPYPDDLLEGMQDRHTGPEQRYELKESIRLAFVTALHLLPPTQRAVLLLRDVLGFRGREVAEMLDMTENSIHGALKRARATLRQRVPADTRETHPAVRDQLAERFAEAFEQDDIDGVIALLTEDAKMTMPPEPLEYQGHDAIAAFLRNRRSRRAGYGFRLVPTRANTQPAFGCYLQDATAPIARAHGLIVLTIAGDQIAGITRFLDNSVYPYFGLPRTLRQAD